MENINANKAIIITGSVLTIIFLALVLLYFYPKGNFNPYYPLSQMRPNVDDNKRNELFNKLEGCISSEYTSVALDPQTTKYSNEDFKMDLEVYCQYITLLIIVSESRNLKNILSLNWIKATKYPTMLPSDLNIVIEGISVPLRLNRYSRRTLLNPQVEQGLDKDLDKFTKQYEMVWNKMARYSIDTDDKKWKNECKTWKEFVEKVKENGFKLDSDKENPMKWLWDIY